MPKPNLVEDPSTGATAGSEERSIKGVLDDRAKVELIIPMFVGEFIDF